MGTKIAVPERIRRMRVKDARHEWMWGKIAADHPGIESTGMEDFEFVNLLRSWCFRNVRREVRIAGEATAGFLDNDPDFGFYGKDAPDIFKAFEENRGGVIGGGCCWSMQTTYEAFDYNAAIIDTGERRGEYSRIGVVVEIYYDGDFIWLAQDPNYDFTVTDLDGRPISYFRLLAHLCRREDDQIKALAGDPEAYRLIISYPHQQGKLETDWTIRPGDPPVETLPDGRIVYKAYMSWAAFQKNPDQRPFRVLERAGLPPKVIYFFMLLFGVYPPHSPFRQMIWERASNVLGDIGALPDD